MRLAVISVLGWCAAALGLAEAAQVAVPVEVVLGRPTDRSVTLSLLAPEPADVWIELREAGGGPSVEAATASLEAGVAGEIALSGLAADSEYAYRVWSRTTGGEAEAGEEHAFHTARPPGSAFTFAVQADPHLDANTSPELLARSLDNVLAARPDFLIDLGDTFMSEKLARTRFEVEARHRLLRSFFAPVCQSVPLFLVLGNHEGETAALLDGSADNVAVWATTARKALFPNPEPDSFYAGDGSNQALVGRRESVYAWEWGDALFVVLDPYWFTSTRPGQGDNWTRTMGSAQAAWLEEVLARSHARFKLVFIHSLVGGLDKDGRGGAEAARFFEWGGRNADGSWGFGARRPGWARPIHEVLVANGVDVVFHGHDHLFARQELDGIVYQEVPQPGWPGLVLQNPAEYGYTSGTFLPSSGFLRVTVKPTSLCVEYVRAYLPRDETAERHNGDVAFAYSVPVEPSVRPPRRRVGGTP